MGHTSARMASAPETSAASELEGAARPQKHAVVVFGSADQQEVKLLLKRLPSSLRVVALGRSVPELAASAEEIAAHGLSSSASSEDKLNAALALADIAVLTAGGGDVQACMPVMKNLRWFHTCWAGVENLMAFSAMAQTRNEPLKPLVTNARGVYSYSLAEYVLYACKYFAIDQPRLDAQKRKQVWNSFETSELRGRVLGVVGYGDIGRAAASLARAYGMVVLAHRRDTGAGEHGNAKGVPDPHGIATRVFGGSEGLLHMLRHCEFVVLVTPLTDETRGFFGTKQFLALDRRSINAKGKSAFVPGSAAQLSQVEEVERASFTQESLATSSRHVPAVPPPPPDEDATEGGLRNSPVFINIGRGKCVDTGALVEALDCGILRGAALDVTDPEPLPENHPLWKMDNVLITPHNADRTTYFQKESVLKFIELSKSYVKAFRGAGRSSTENSDRLRRFAEVAGASVVDKTAGY